jgi:Barstar (barnase inhibitor)
VAPFRLNDIGAASSVHFELSFDLRSQHGAEIQNGAFVVREVSCQEFSSPTDCFQAIGEVFSFPQANSFYAQNANAFLDYLTDLSWYAALQGIVLVLRSGDVLMAKWPYIAGMLIEVWLRAAAFWEKEGVSCHLIFDLSAECSPLPGRL